MTGSPLQVAARISHASLRLRRSPHCQRIPNPLEVPTVSEHDCFAGARKARRRDGRRGRRAAVGCACSGVHPLAQLPAELIRRVPYGSLGPGGARLTRLDRVLA